MRENEWEIKRSKTKRKINRIASEPTNDDKEIKFLRGNDEKISRNDVKFPYH